MLKAGTTEVSDNLVEEMVRPRIFAHICHNCKNYVPSGLDEPEDKPFCVLDGREANEYQFCEGWAKDNLKGG